MLKNKSKEIKKWLRCPRCSSRNIVYRARVEDYQCRLCGAVFEANWKETHTILKDEGGNK